jgi:hypothetical protein
MAIAVLLASATAGGCSVARSQVGRPTLDPSSVRVRSDDDGLHYDVAVGVDTTDDDGRCRHR